MLPGDYTWTVYQGELAVRTGSVTVGPGSTTALHTIGLTPADDPGQAPAIWRIGRWDGTRRASAMPTWSPTHTPRTCAPSRGPATSPWAGPGTPTSPPISGGTSTTAGGSPST
ncbi:hypothetical protein [Streptomyces sp. 1331.2]|uniref:hypothetical protein n=1 Tax=Streptomyces sp. 1331.2 TaxID=1938835 RepID=UPI0027BA5B12|nr:hypothetical protein [Streptomyces sp. 1331.2]